MIEASVCDPDEVLRGSALCQSHPIRTPAPALNPFGPPLLGQRAAALQRSSTAITCCFRIRRRPWIASGD